LCFQIKVIDSLISLTQHTGGAVTVRVASAVSLSDNEFRTYGLSIAPTITHFSYPGCSVTGARHEERAMTVDPYSAGFLGSPPAGFFHPFAAAKEAPFYLWPVWTVLLIAFPCLTPRFFSLPRPRFPQSLVSQIALHVFLERPPFLDPQLLDNGSFYPSSPTTRSPRPFLQVFESLLTGLFRTPIAIRRCVSV